jgi:type I restriction enzyme S subunit
MRKDTNYPSEWQRTTFEDVAHYINGYAFKPEDWGNVGLPIIRIAQINDPETDHDYYDGPIADDYVIEDGDLLFSWSATLTTLIWNRGPALLNQHIFKVIPQEGVDLHFLHHLIDYKIEDLARQSHGSTMKHIKKSDLLPFPLVIPPLPEQRRIAEILDAADAAIRETERVIAKLRQVKQGLLHDLLTRGLDAHGHLRDPDVHPEQFKDSPLGRIPRDWEILPLAEVAAVNRGKFSHRPRNDPDYYGGQYPFIQTGDIASAEGDLITSYSQTLNERGSAVSRDFPVGTIAITIAANIADTAILGIPMYFPDSIVGAVVKEPHNNRYIELCIRRAKRRLEAQAPQSAQKNINLGILRPLRIPVPNPNEQNRIAETYESLVARIRAEEAVLAKRRQVKRGLMDDLLTGRVRV